MISEPHFASYIAYPDRLDGLLGVVVDGDVHRDLLAVVVDLLVQGALQHDLPLGAHEALVGRGRGRALLLLVRGPLDLWKGTKNEFSHFKIIGKEKMLRQKSQGHLAKKVIPPKTEDKEEKKYRPFTKYLFKGSHFLLPGLIPSLFSSESNQEASNISTKDSE